VTAPRMTSQLDALRSFMAARPAGGGKPGGPHVLVVGSGKGGAGTSVVASLVALSAAAAGRRVLLVDADPHVGPLRYLLGTPDAPALADLRAGLDVERAATPVSATLSLVAGGPGSSRTPADPAEHRALLRRVTTLYPKHDLVVVDGGSRLDTVCASCEAGNAVPTRLLVVAGTDPIALAASYALVKAATDRSASLPGGPLSCDVIVNRHDEDAARRAYAQLDAAVRDFLGKTPAQAGVRYAGALPDDVCLDVALRAGMPLQDAAAGSPAAVAAQSLVERLLSALPSSALLAHPPGALR
jgi:flagellar biosynthesis protein FlhG